MCITHSVYQHNFAVPHNKSLSEHPGLFLPSSPPPCPAPPLHTRLSACASGPEATLPTPAGFSGDSSRLAYVVDDCTFSSFAIPSKDQLHSSFSDEDRQALVEVLSSSGSLFRG